MTVFDLDSCSVGREQHGKIVLPDRKSGRIDVCFFLNKMNPLSQILVMLSLLGWELAGDRRPLYVKPILNSQIGCQALPVPQSFWLIRWDGNAN